MSDPGAGSASAGDRSKKCLFYDMKHSNNAARVRLWLRLKGGLEHVVQTIMISHDDLYTESYSNINPLRKVPAFVTDTGLRLFEASIIMHYLEDRFGEQFKPPLTLDAPDDRAFVNLLVRVHDLYIASPNCTQPNFSHTQGCMYLDPHETEFTPSTRTMDIKTRAAKAAEIFKQLSWLEKQIRLPYMAGQQVTHADLTWFPTSIFMELMLPTVFGWSPIFHEIEVFPKLTDWFSHCMKSKEFQRTRSEIRGTLEEQAKRGRFEAVRLAVERSSEYKWKYM